MENAKKLTGFLPANVVEYAKKTYKIAVFGVKNNLVLAGILLIGYCVIAPAVFASASSNVQMDSDYLRNVMGIYSMIAAYVGGLLIPSVMFAYVHKRRDRDFYHSMPVKRGQYFIGYFASGLAMYVVPYLLMCVIMGLFGGGRIDVVFEFTLQSIALYIIIYATSTFSVMFSGSMLSSIVTLAFLNAFPVIVTFCSLSFSGTLDSTAYQALLAPYIFIFTPLSGGYGFYSAFIDYGVYDWLLWVQLGIAAVELVLAFIMYQFRRGETTMAVAFPKTRYILQYGIMFLVALFSTAVFSTSFWWLGDGGTTTVIWTAIFVFVAFVLMNMILEQNFRAAFHKIRHLFIFAAAYVVILTLILNLVSSLPSFVIPIRTDAVLIRYQHFVITEDEPDGLDEERRWWYYTYGEYAGEYALFIPDGNGRNLYRIDLGENYYMVTDPEQVKVLTKRISDHKNTAHEYIDYNSIVGEFDYVSFTLYTLKPGKEVTAGMYLDEIQKISSQYYSVFLSNISASETESFKDGMDLMKTDWQPTWRS